MEIPPEFAEILEVFPFRKPDRIVWGEDNAVVVAEWLDGDYFEIEYDCLDKAVTAMSGPNGSGFGHWYIRPA